MNSKLLLADKKPISQLLVLLAFVFVSVALFAILSLVASVFLFDINIMSPNGLTDYTNPNVIAALKFMQFWQALGLFVFPPIAWVFLVSKNRMEVLGLKQTPNLIYVALVALLVVFGQPLINFFAEVNQSLVLPDFMSGIEQWMKRSEEQAEIITKAFLKMDGAFDLSLNILIIALLPAIGEELLFRGALQPLLIKTAKNKHLGIWLGAILFSAMHMQFYGFLPRMLLGAAFGYIYFWSGNLWFPIFGHFINNGSAVVMAYLIGIEKLDESAETIGANSAVMVLVSAFVSSIVLWFFFKNHRKESVIA